MAWRGLMVSLPCRAAMKEERICISVNSEEEERSSIGC